jgi:acyl-CoA synthetase (AMP-forming)/AMP-acid ligase II
VQSKTATAVDAANVAKTLGDGLSTFVDIVSERAATRRDQLAYRFQQGRSQPLELTFGQLHERALALAASMQSLGLKGERVLLACKAQDLFVVAFYACMFAGAIAVPTAPPRRRHLVDRLSLIRDDARVRAVASDVDELLDAVTGEGWQGVDRIDLRHATDDGNAWLPFVPLSDMPAFLQYTSGSTGDPKGVVVTHGNLVHNSEVIRQGMGIGEASVILVGLPLFHDMGLIGGVLQSMYAGCSTTFMPPAELIQYPERWIRAISSLRVTVSGGPNFMYETALEGITDDDLAGIDLSCWKVAFCGAEPIRAAAVERFARRFASAGFCELAFYACYGMAEATLFVSGGEPGQPTRISTRHGTDVVSCGSPRHGMTVRIVDPETLSELPDGEVGEIWVAGDSVAQGYWGREAVSKEVFRARPQHEDIAHLRTGDLGWIERGELFVAGRLKDLIIVNGRNVAPQDVEQACTGAHEALVKGGTAAFSVDRGRGEEIVVVAEIERTWTRREDSWPDIMARMKAAVMRDNGLAVTDVVFIRQGALPRTSSGKVRRSSTRSAYLDRSLSLLSTRVAS